MTDKELIEYHRECLQEIWRLQELFYTIDCSTESCPNLKRLPPELVKYSGPLLCIFKTADYGLHPEKLEAMKKRFDKLTEKK